MILQHPCAVLKALFESHDVKHWGQKAESISVTVEGLGAVGSNVDKCLVDGEWYANDKGEGVQWRLKGDVK